MTVKKVISRGHLAQHITDMDSADTDTRHTFTGCNKFRCLLKWHVKSRAFSACKENQVHVYQCQQKPPVTTLDANALKDVNDFNYLDSYTSEAMKVSWQERASLGDACNKLRIQHTTNQYLRRCERQLLCLCWNYFTLPMWDISHK